MSRERKHRESNITSKIMRAVKSKNSKAELILAKKMWNLGLRYRKHSKNILGKPDFIFIGAKVAVFVDGDFWHGKGWASRGFSSWEEQFEGLNNSRFWLEKISSTMARDKRINKTLRSEGWLVIRCLESEIISNSSKCAHNILIGVQTRKISLQKHT
jgi:DNA mismatch endonuclease, patch repair protein